MSFRQHLVAVGAPVLVLIILALAGCPAPTANIYTVTYNANGATSGSAPTDSNNYLQGVTVAVLSNTGSLVRTGYAFAGWNTAADGSGSSYAAGATFAMGIANVTLYTVWIPSDLTFTSSGTAITITGSATAPSGTLVIPGGVTCVGSRAFMNCYGLTGLTLPESLLFIEDYAFFSCGGLSSLTIPPRVSRIGEYAFCACTGLGSITVPAGVTSIGDNAFSGSLATSMEVDPANSAYASLNGVLYDKGFTALLQVPGGMTGSFAVPAGVTSIHDGAFVYGLLCAHTNGLASIDIPASVVTIGEQAFGQSYCLVGIAVDPANPSYASISGVLFTKDLTTLVKAPGKIAGAYTIPASVVKIGTRAFFFCASLTHVSFPNGVVDIAFQAFQGCIGLLGVDIPGSTTTIGRWSFADCTSLTSVTIPLGVTKVGDNAFNGCASLASVIMESTLPPSLLAASNAFLGCAGNLQIHVPAGTLATYLGATGWSDYASRIVSP